LRMARRVSDSWPPPPRINRHPRAPHCDDGLREFARDDEEHAYRFTTEPIRDSLPPPTIGVSRVPTGR
jgi:hypothetical protein